MIVKNYDELVRTYLPFQYDLTVTLLQVLLSIHEDLLGPPMKPLEALKRNQILL